MKQRAVFLDRDGVINSTFVADGIPRPPQDVSEVSILPMVKEAVALLANSGFLIVVVTNQPDISRKLLSEDQVININSYIGNILGIHEFRVCPHDDSDECTCRKPKPGLLIQAANDLDIDLKSSFMVGDRWRDVSAGQAAGCEVFFIDYGYGEEKPVLPYTQVSSLFVAARIILEEHDD